jgi:hypothetical protein
MTYFGNLIMVLVVAGGGLMATAPTTDQWRASEPPQRPAVVQPEPTAGAERVPAEPVQPPKVRTGARSRIVSGVATWYRYHVGGAAAGPALRKALGADWRGTTVTVCNEADTCVDAALTDSCWCPKGNRVIDLDSRLFDDLAPLGTGVLAVTVYR